MSTGTGHSFVYPVRFLLTGNNLPRGSNNQQIINRAVDNVNEINDE